MCITIVVVIDGYGRCITSTFPINRRSAVNVCRAIPNVPSVEFRTQSEMLSSFWDSAMVVSGRSLLPPLTSCLIIPLLEESKGIVQWCFVVHFIFTSRWIFLFYWFWDCSGIWRKDFWCLIFVKTSFIDQPPRSIFNWIINDGLTYRLHLIQHDGWLTKNVFTNSGQQNSFLHV